MHAVRYRPKLRNEKYKLINYLTRGSLLSMTGNMEDNLRAGGSSIIRGGNKIPNPRPLRKTFVDKGLGERAFINILPITKPET